MILSPGCLGWEPREPDDSELLCPRCGEPSEIVPGEGERCDECGVVEGLRDDIALQDADYLRARWAEEVEHG